MRGTLTAVFLGRNAGRQPLLTTKVLGEVHRRGPGSAVALHAEGLLRGTCAEKLLRELRRACRRALLVLSGHPSSRFPPPARRLTMWGRQIWGRPFLGRRAALARLSGGRQRTIIALEAREVAETRDNISKLVAQAGFPIFSGNQG